MSPKCSACYAFKSFDLALYGFLRVSPEYTLLTPAMLLKLFYSSPYLKKPNPGTQKGIPKWSPTEMIGGSKSMPGAMF